MRNILQPFTVAIAYEPLDSEPNWQNLPHHFSDVLLAPSSAQSDPFLFAEECSTRFKETEACILVPGTAFDALGTRHGRGGGWYDKFLSCVPRTWLRVGLCTRGQFQESPLVREQWDEPMGMVFVLEQDESWSVYDTRTSSVY